MIVSPPNEAWLPNNSIAFQWTGMGVFTACTLSVSAIAPGDTDILGEALGAGTSLLVTNLPWGIGYIYVRIGSKTSSGWLYVDYTYIAPFPLPGALISPTNGSTLPGSTVTFQWSAAIGGSQYWLYVSKVAPGSGDLDSINAGSQTALTLTNLPVDGSTIYVRLSSLLNGAWQYADYSFTAAGLPEVAMVSPVNGSTLPGATVTFQWSGAVGATQYWLYVSSLAPGGQEIYSGSQGTNTSKTLTNIPTNGSKLYIRLWCETGASWQFSDYSYTTAAALVQLAAVANSASLTSYLAATPFSAFDFSAFPEYYFATPPTLSQLTDGTLTLAFSSTMAMFLAPDFCGWGVAPNSERTNDSVVLPVLDAYNPSFNSAAAWDPETNWFGLSNLTITLSRPVWTFGFEADPDDAGTITATFYTASSGSITVAMNLSYSNSRIFAATGAPITKVTISLTNGGDYPDFTVGAFRYAQSEPTAPGASQASTAMPPSPAVMTSPANGATLPGSTVTFQWSAGAGVSEYWLYLSNVAPGGKEIYSGVQGSKTSATFTNLPSDGSMLYVRLWSQIGAAWQYHDYTYKTAIIR